MNAILRFQLTRCRIVQSCLKRFIRDQQGQFAVITALTLTVTVLSLAVAVDITQVERSKARLQDAADSAIIAAARDMAISRLTLSQANRTAQSTIAAMKNKTDNTQCNSINISGDNLTISCRGSVRSAIPLITGKTSLAYNVNAATALPQNRKIEFALVYDISDSMLTDGRLQAMEKALNDFLSAEIFESASFNAVFSLIPFANSVSFSDNYTRWLDPYNGYSLTSTFSGCFMPEATDPSIPFRGRQTLIAAPNKTNNKNSPLCPSSRMNAKFFLNQKSQAITSISNIETGNGTGSSEGLIWGYRSLHPSMRGIISSNRYFPRNFAEDNNKVLIFLTDGKPKNKPWVGKGNSPTLGQESEDLFLQACRYIRSQNDNIDVYMIGFGDLSRAGTDLAPILSQCTKGTGQLFLADNTNLKDALLNIAADQYELALIH